VLKYARADVVAYFHFPVVVCGRKCYWGVYIAIVWKDGERVENGEGLGREMMMEGCSDAWRGDGG
jgi:hypothetical protein